MATASAADSSGLEFESDGGVEAGAKFLVTRNQLGAATIGSVGVSGMALPRQVSIGGGGFDVDSECERCDAVGHFAAKLGASVRPSSEPSVTGGAGGAGAPSGSVSAIGRAGVAAPMPTTGAGRVGAILAEASSSRNAPAIDLDDVAWESPQEFAAAIGQ